MVNNTTTVLWKTKTFWLSVGAIALTVLSDEKVIQYLNPAYVTIAVAVLAAIFRADARKEVRMPVIGTPTERKTGKKKKS